MKKIIYFGVFFVFVTLVSLSFTSALTINQFNNSLTTENLTFTGNENITRYLSINKNANVTSAFLNLSGSPAISICYQESANTTNQTGIDGDCGLKYDGAYIAQDGINHFFINYSKPSFAINATWRVKHGFFSEYNVSIPQTCFDSSDILQLRFFSSFNAPRTSSSFGQCYNGTWNTITKIALSGQVFDGAAGASDPIFLYDGNFNTQVANELNFGTWEKIVRGGLFNASIYEEGIYWDMFNSQYIEIGTPDGIYEWNNLGEFNETFSSTQTDDFSFSLNTALDSGDCTGGILKGDNCIVPFLFHSDTLGTLNYFDININALVNVLFDNVNVTNNLDVGNDLSAIQGFFDYLGNSVSRIVKGWFTEIDSVNITTQSITVNNSQVCLEDGTNCLPDKNTNILSFTTNVYDTISPTDYGSLSGTDPFNVDEEKVKNVIPTNCLFKDLYVDVASNTRSTSSTLDFRINGVNGNLSVIIPGNTVGVFSDTVNTDNANAGDLVNYEIIRGPGGKGKTLIRSIAVLCEIK